MAQPHLHICTSAYLHIKIMETPDDTLRRTFTQLLSELSPKEQRKALTAAMRREANAIKQAAWSNVRSAPPSKKGSTGMARDKVYRGIYTRIYPKRYGLGFLVTVKPHGSKGIHTNRRGKQKPVLMFAEEGTKNRNVGPRRGQATLRRGIFARKKWRDYRRTGHTTGSMPRYGFLARAEQTETPGIEQRLWAQFEQNVQRAADNI